MSKVLASLDRRWIQAASRELSTHLTNLIETGIGINVTDILAWRPYFIGEVDLSSFIAEQLSRRRVYLPRILPNRNLCFVRIGDDWLQNSEPGLGGIPAPAASCDDQYDRRYAATTAVIVPGFAFDSIGNRVGRDNGSYSRFFREQMMSSVKIGVCWSLQYLREVPEISEEVCMDWVCHERAVVRTGVEFEEDW